MIDPQSVEQLFQLLEKSTLQRGEFRVAETGVQAGAGPVLLAVDSGRRLHVLVPLPPGSVVKEDRSSSGVHLVQRDLEEEGGAVRMLDAVCLKPHLQHVFVHFASEVLRGIAEAPADPARVCRATLERWRELLERERARVLGPEALAGLFGELLHLVDLARISPDALGAWKGPDNARHDFSRGAAALEVKATTRREGRFFQVHGVEQLEPPLGGELFLAAVKLEKTDSGGESVVGLIEELRSLGVAYGELLARLAAAGYDPADEQFYAGERFVVKERRVYRVEGGFPRIVPGSFAGGSAPPGVLSLAYTIDLTGEPPHPLPEESVEQVLQLLAGGEP